LTVEAEETEMSNPHDDPGRRPPPPRQGEPPSSYPGGPPPPYQGDPHAYPGDGQQYQGPPQQAWQSQGGYGPAPQPPMGPPGYPVAKGKGLFGALFDLNFDEMVSTKLIKAFYLLALLLISLTSLFVLLVGLWALQFGWGRYFGVFLVPAAPLMWLFELVVTRMTLEFVINQFKITEHLKVIRDREGPR
jgi:uncharacterized protein DUF4282